MPHAMLGDSKLPGKWLGALESAASCTLQRAPASRSCVNCRQRGPPWQSCLPLATSHCARVCACHDTLTLRTSHCCSGVLAMWSRGVRSGSTVSSVPCAPRLGWAHAMMHAQLMFRGLMQHGIVAMWPNTERSGRFRGALSLSASRFERAPTPCIAPAQRNCSMGQKCFAFCVRYLSDHR